MIERNYVRGEGPLHAKLMVIGEAPGADEDRERRPFVGASGRLLNKFLHDAGIERSQVYVTNIVKVRPPDNKFERLREFNLSPLDFLPELWDEVNAVRPNCILALGKNALKFLTGRSGKGNSITENRGSILRLVSASRYECKVISTFHPASLLHMRGSDVADPMQRIFMQSDFKKAVEESITPDFDLPRRSLLVAQNSQDVWRYINRNRDKINPITGRKLMGCDIEVKSAVPTVLGLSFDPYEALAIPLLDFPSPYVDGSDHLCVSPRDVADSLRTVWQYVNDENVDIVGQNFKFDHDKIEPRGMFVKGRIIDIMLIHATVYPEFPKSIEFMLSVHTREPFYKNDQMYKTTLRNLCIGCGRDAAVSMELAGVLLPLLKEFGLWDFYFGYDRKDWRWPLCVEQLHDLYRHMDHIGFPFDENKNKELKQKYTGMAAAQQVELDMLVGSKVNVQSPKQVAFLLYEHLKLPKRGKSGAGTDEDTLVALMNSPATKNEEHRRIMELILEIRRIRKNIGTYLNAERDFDGRMRTNYKIVGTETGRTSTSKQDPPVRPYSMGLSFQTMTKHGEIGPDLRKQFPVDPGFCYLQADSKQAEARVVWLLAENYEGLARLDDPGYDVHAETASWFYPGSDVELLKKDKPRRFTGKTIRHSGHYDVSKRPCMMKFNSDAKKFGLDIQISEWKAGQLLELFHKNDPPIKDVFHKQIIDVVNDTRVLISPFGRRREFFGNPDDHGFYKEAYAQIPQATVADNTKRAMLGIRHEVPDIRFVLEWHDGFLAMVPIREVELYARLFNVWMEKPIDFSECSLPRKSIVIPCELEYSETTYYDMETYELDRRGSIGN